MFAPSGLGVKSVISSSKAWTTTSSAKLTTSGGLVTPYGQGYLLVRSRQRITLDGGHSLLAVPNKAGNTRPVLRITAQTSAEGVTQAEEHSGLFYTMREFVELADSTGIEEIKSTRAESSIFETCADENGSNYQLEEQTDIDAFNIAVPDNCSDEVATKPGQSYSVIELNQCIKYQPLTPKKPRERQTMRTVDYSLQNPHRTLHLYHRLRTW